jgi:PPOX class probable F420-dependent enzyme
VEPAEARRRFAAARVARLATVGEDGRPHLVPVTFALDGDTIVTAVDHKPKRTLALRRLANIAANPRVALLADEYSDGDWSALWWARADGTARVVAQGDERLGWLVARYEQYRQRPPEGPVILVDVERWSGWSAAGP